ncbi:protein kinase C zeta type-like [Balaenoptera acutorostrata]|uniref:Protein kinase C zeta type-like n=1 Tax=Balaenoptera acutorostrata TaxID=9767 RepID=A0ABM3RX41_BALAC|nr:protein kinase C zeta type-like [Balaenoptera acutorostrata]
MPSRTGRKMDGGGGRGRLKAHYSGDILITGPDSATTFDKLCEEVREMCHLHQDHPLTLRWVDSEGDPCTVSSQMELEEPFRLSCQRKDEGLILHVFPSTSEEPGMPCPGEDRRKPRAHEPSQLLRSAPDSHQTAPSLRSYLV